MLDVDLLMSDLFIILGFSFFMGLGCLDFMLWFFVLYFELILDMYISFDVFFVFLFLGVFLF